MAISHFMSPSPKPPRSWSPSGPAPPTPFVVNASPVYFDGRHTPLPSPAPVVDDFAPCPPTPYCVPSEEPLGAPEAGPPGSESTQVNSNPCILVVPQPVRPCTKDSIKWLNTPDAAEPYQSISSEDWFAPQQEEGTRFEDPLDALAAATATVVHPDPYGLLPNPSDFLIYDRFNYAYPSPVLAMVKRAELDNASLKTQPVDEFACGLPFKQFSITAGYVPFTGDPKNFEQTFEYYVLFTMNYLQRDVSLSYRFSMATIQAIQLDLPVQWPFVVPQPIPPVIVRLHDLVGPHILTQRNDGFAFVVPTDDSIWRTACQRGVDSDFRPIDPSAAVAVPIYTRTFDTTTHVYQPQHIVASQFAVNLFLELPDTSGTFSGPRCEYLGAFVLQVVDGLTVRRTQWQDIDPSIQQSVFDRVPHYFEGVKHPSRGWPRLPCINFRYYMWDLCMVGLADQTRNRNALAMSRVENSLS